MKTMRFGEDDANEAAQNAVAWAYEECKFGRQIASTEHDFWAIVSARVYKEKRQEASSRFVSMDASTPDGHANGHDFGWRGRTEANQIDYVASREILRALPLLPVKHREVLQLLADGYNAVDIGKELNMPIWLVFRRINDARAYLFSADLVGMVHESR